MGFKQGELLVIKAEIEVLITRREKMLMGNEWAKMQGRYPAYNSEDFEDLEKRLDNIIMHVNAMME